MSLCRRQIIRLRKKYTTQVERIVPMRGHRYVTEINVVAQTVRSGNPAATEPDCLFCRWAAGAA